MALSRMETIMSEKDHTEGVASKVGCKIRVGLVSMDRENLMT